MEFFLLLRFSNKEVLKYGSSNECNLKWGPTRVSSTMCLVHGVTCLFGQRSLKYRGYGYKTLNFRGESGVVTNCIHVYFKHLIYRGKICTFKSIELIFYMPLKFTGFSGRTDKINPKEVFRDLNFFKYYFKNNSCSQGITPQLIIKYIFLFNSLCLVLPVLLFVPSSIVCFNSQDH